MPWIDASGLDTLRAADTVQYLAHKPAHMHRLEQGFVRFTETASADDKATFDAFVAQAGQPLQDFATYEAQSEIAGADWRVWGNVAATPPQERRTFHMWLQWLATQQLAAAQSRALDAGMPLGLYLDLAVGPRRDGAESYCEQSSIASGVSIGAPPDHLSPEGQKWNLAAFAPLKLRANRYAPLRRILAQTMRYAGVIRIDHVLGLNRSFWIPDDGSAGGYIRQPFEALLAVIKIEAERHNCLVIGEDLGLVPDGFRDTMAGHGFYGYSVRQYEKDDSGQFRAPADVPAQVLSCFATHDTPTLHGYAVGRDIEWWRSLNWIDDATARRMQDERTQDVAAATGPNGFEATIHQSLAASGAGLVAVQLDDVLQAVEAQNLPGTIDEHPNWRRKYDTDIQQLPDDPRLTDIATMMRNADRAT